MQLRYQQHNGIAVVLVSNYAAQYNRGFEISGQFILVHDNYDLVFLSHFTHPKRKLLRRTSGSISGNNVLKMH